MRRAWTAHAGTAPGERRGERASLRNEERLAVARLGGDEFALFSNEMDEEKIAARIQEKFAKESPVKQKLIERALAVAKKVPLALDPTTIPKYVDPLPVPLQRLELFLLRVREGACHAR